MVDSSLGGKTGINHAAGKNLIGSIYPPRLVLSDPALLATLPDREFASGLAEAVKHALIADADFVAWWEQHLDAVLARDPARTAEAVARAQAIKAAFVADDEFEHGARALLNFGHTFAHAFEAVAGYGTLLHGEAVALGMQAALVLSHARTPALPLARLRALVARLPLPAAPCPPGRRRARRDAGGQKARRGGPALRPPRRARPCRRGAGRGRGRGARGTRRHRDQRVEGPALRAASPLRAASTHIPRAAAFCGGSFCRFWPSAFVRRLLAAPGFVFRTALGVLVLGGIVFVALTRTQVGRERLRVELETAFAQQFNGTLTLDTLAGDLVGTLDARGVTIRDAQGVPVLTAQRLVAHPTLRGLVSRDFELRSVTLTGPHVWLRRDRAAVWNVARLLRPRATAAPRTAPQWRFGAPVVRIERGDAGDRERRAAARRHRLGPPGRRVQPAVHPGERAGHGGVAQPAPRASGRAPPYGRARPRLHARRPERAVPRGAAGRPHGRARAGRRSTSGRARRRPRATCGCRSGAMPKDASKARSTPPPCGASCRPCRSRAPCASPPPGTATRRASSSKRSMPRPAARTPPRSGRCGGAETRSSWPPARSAGRCARRICRPSGRQRRRRPCASPETGRRSRSSTCTSPSTGPTRAATPCPRRGASPCPPEPPKAARPSPPAQTCAGTSTSTRAASMWPGSSPRSCPPRCSPGTLPPPGAPRRSTPPCCAPPRRAWPSRSGRAASTGARSTRSCSTAACNAATSRAASSSGRAPPPRAAPSTARSPTQQRPSASTRPSSTSTSALCSPPTRSARACRASWRPTSRGGRWRAPPARSASAYRRRWSGGAIRRSMRGHSRSRSTATPAVPGGSWRTLPGSMPT